MALKLAMIVAAVSVLRSRGIVGPAGNGDDQIAGTRGADRGGAASEYRCRCQGRFGRRLSLLGGRQRRLQQAGQGGEA